LSLDKNSKNYRILFYTEIAQNPRPLGTHKQGSLSEEASTRFSGREGRGIYEVFKEGRKRHHEVFRERRKRHNEVFRGGEEKA